MRQNFIKKYLASIIWVFLQFLTTMWGILAIYYSNLPPSLRVMVSVLFGAVSVGIGWFVRPRRKYILTYSILFASLVTWWLFIPPQADRDWRPDLALLPYADVHDGSITFHNIRNIDYRSETDYTVHHYDETFNLGDLQTVDFYLVYWGSPKIAHTMISFGFGNDKYVCFSIETRNERHEGFSAIKGFFKQYELTYILADERDVVRLRTNFRHEDVYLYRINIQPERARLVLMDYVRSMNQLKEKPQWYNAFSSNCTTNIRKHTSPYNPEAKLDWRILINGYLDEFVYEQGFLYQGLPFFELKRKSYINPLAQAAGQDLHFSKKIREGLPGF